MEIQTSSLINEINDSMNFDTEKTNKTRNKNKKKLQVLFKSFFQKKLQIKSTNPSKLIPTTTKKVSNSKHHRSKYLYHGDRIKEWNEMTKIESNDFHKKDRLAKYKLAKIIPTEISKKRMQKLIVPIETAPNSLKRLFQYLAYMVKNDLVSECTTTQPTNYRPLTFSPDFIIRSEGTKKYPVDINDWNAGNLMIFQNLANLLYGLSLDFCNPVCCPVMTVGKRYEYVWSDGVTFVEPVSIPARTYMKFCLLWTQKQLKDPMLVPSISDASYPKDAHSTWKMVYRRLFRVYAHLYINHQDDFDKHGVMGAVLNCMLRRLILFGIEGKLTSKKELEPVKLILKKIKRELLTNEEYKK